MSPNHARTGDRSGEPLALAVADANWYTTENLFREVDRDHVSTLLLKCIDYHNAWQRGQPPWAWGRALAGAGPELWRARPGPALRLDEAVPAPRDAADRAGRSAAGGAEHAADGPLALVMTYPHYLYLRDQVRPDRQVYFNIDDYSQYWPRLRRPA